MRTEFSPEQLADPDTAAADEALRKCVHCGMCMATCPTYTLLGNELDGPRGRIYLIKDMLENDRPAGPVEARHIDRCLSCMACMTTCPSGVNYMHLVDHARAHIQKTFTRPRPERMLRWMLKTVLPRPRVFRLALRAARLARPFAALAPGRLKGMMAMAPRRIPPASWSAGRGLYKADGARRMRVVLMTGCAQQVLRPSINDATIRLLTRHGCEVITPKDQGCCGALVRHMGFENDAHAAAKRNIEAWERAAGQDDRQDDRQDGGQDAAQDGGLDAVVINTSGCGVAVKDYGWMLRNDPDWAGRAARISALAKDITEVMTELGLNAPMPSEPLPAVAYHAACSMQHGQRIKDAPKDLLRQAGFEVREPAEAHLCCGSAGTYNIMQPEIAGRLKARKAANLDKTGAAVIATANIGCLEQISGAAKAPALHTAELLDWATGGPRPSGLPPADGP